METNNQTKSLPLTMGLIIGLVYCIFIFIQNQFFYANPMQFSAIKLLCYLLIIGGYAYSAYMVKKSYEGYITFQECLKVLLIVILITELLYAIFSTLYVSYIEPSFLEKLKTSWSEYFIKNKVPQDKIDETLKQFDEAKNITFWRVIQSYGFSIIIDIIFALIIAAIMKKKRPVFEELDVK